MSRSSLVRAVAMALGFFVSAISLYAQVPWKGFRGASFGQTNAKGLPMAAGDFGVRWSLDVVGVGQSSPVIHGQRAFVTSIVAPAEGADESDRGECLVHAVDTVSGELAWTVRRPASSVVFDNDMKSKAAPTPVVTSERVVAFFESGDLYGLSLEGKVLWHRSFVEECGPFGGNHGLGSSIAGQNGIVILPIEHSGSSRVLAIDSLDGSTVWEVSRSPRITWTTPIVIEDPAGRSVVVHSSNGSVAAYELETGEPLWEVGDVEKNTVASPTLVETAALGQVLLVASSSKDHNMALQLQLDGAPKVLWKGEDARPCSFASPVSVGALALSTNKAGVVTALDVATGQKRWKHRNSQGNWATPVVSGNMVWFFGTEGVIDVLRVADDGVDAVAAHTLEIEDKVYGVAVADGPRPAFVLRTERGLLCVANKAAAGSLETPRAIASFGAARAGDYLYLQGGHIGRAHAHSKDNIVADFYRIDVTSLEDEDGSVPSWERLPDGAPVQGTALVAHGEVVYQVGGLTAHNAPGEEEDLVSIPGVARFDGSKPDARWEPVTPLPEQRSSHDAVVVGDSLYVVGGWALRGKDQEPKWHDTAWVADLRQDPIVWQALPKPPFIQRALSASRCGDKILVVGGMDDWEAMAPETYLYDPVARVWSTAADYPSEPFGMAAWGDDGASFASGMGGTLWAFTGEDWRKVGQLAEARFFHRIEPIGRDADGVLRLITVGGASRRKGHLSSVEVLSVPLDAIGSR